MTDFSQDAPGVLADAIEPIEVRAALQRICQSADFKRSSRLTDLLRYIVTEEVEGRGPRLKAYSIATEVLGRKADFDPSSDSIVRVEMARLRIALKLYYAAADAVAVVIDVPKGRYRPYFSRPPEPPADPPPMSDRTAELVEFLRADAPLPANNLATIPAAIPVKKAAASPIALLVCLILMLSGISAYLLLMQPRDLNDRLPPLVLVAPVKIASAEAPIMALGQTLQSVLVSEIANDPLLAVAFLADERQPPAGAIRENRALYVLSISIGANGDRWSVSANLQDGRTSTVLWSRSEKVPAVNADGLSWAYDLSRRLAIAIGDPFGVVARTELASSSEGLPASRQCLIRLRQAKIQWTDLGLRLFAECVGKLPGGGEAESALALALMAHGNYAAVRWLSEPDRNGKLELAWRQIAKAQAIEPHLNLVETTAIRIAACRKDDTAVERMLRTFVGRRAYNTQAIFEAAYLHAFLLGDLATSERLTEQGRQLAVNPQPTEFLPPALWAFQKGDMAEVASLLKRSINHSHPAKNVLWLVASAGLKDEAAYRSALTRLADSGFRTPEAILGIVANSCWNSRIKSDIATALRSALESGVGRAP